MYHGHFQHMCCGLAFSAPAGQEVPAWVARGRPRRSGGLRPRAAGTAARQEKDFVTHAHTHFVTHTHTHTPKKVFTYFSAPGNVPGYWITEF